VKGTRISADFHGSNFLYLDTADDEEQVNWTYCIDRTIGKIFSISISQDVLQEKYSGLRKEFASMYVEGRLTRAQKTFWKE
jgi:hypothetical protein